MFDGYKDRRRQMRWEDRGIYNDEDGNRESGSGQVRSGQARVYEIVRRTSLGRDRMQTPKITSSRRAPGCGGREEEGRTDRHVENTRKR